MPYDSPEFVPRCGRLAFGASGRVDELLGHLDLARLRAGRDEGARGD